MLKLTPMCIGLMLLTGASILLTGCFSVRAENRPLTFIQTPKQPIAGITTYSIETPTTNADPGLHLKGIEIPGLQKAVPGTASISVKFNTAGLEMTFATLRVEKYENKKDGTVTERQFRDFSAQLSVELSVVRGNDILLQKSFTEKGSYSCAANEFNEGTSRMTLSNQYMSSIAKQAQLVLASEFGTFDRRVTVSVWSNSDFEEFESAKANALRALSARSIGDNVEATKQWEAAIPRWKSIISNVETDKDGKPKFKDAHKAAASFNIAQALVWMGKLDEAMPYAKRALELSGDDGDYRQLPGFIQDLMTRKISNPTLFKL